MSRYRFTLELDIDDIALAEHNGELRPPPNDVSEWDPGDLLVAQDLELLNFRDGTLERIEKVPE